MIGRCVPAPSVEWRKFQTLVREEIPHDLGYWGRDMDSHLRVSRNLRSCIYWEVMVRLRGIEVSKSIASVSMKFSSSKS